MSLVVAAVFWVDASGKSMCFQGTRIANGCYFEGSRSASIYRVRRERIITPKFELRCLFVKNRVSVNVLLNGRWKVCAHNAANHIISQYRVDVRLFL